MNTREIVQDPTFSTGKAYVNEAYLNEGCRRAATSDHWVAMSAGLLERLTFSTMSQHGRSVMDVYRRNRWGEKIRLAVSLAISLGMAFKAYGLWTH